jgi:hypothetical protein
LKGLLRALPIAIGSLAFTFGVLILIFMYGLEPNGLFFRLLRGPLGQLLGRLEPHLNAENPFVVIFLFLAAFYVAVLIHELGHVAAGLAVRYPFVYVMVGPVRITKEKQHFKLSFHKQQLSGLALHLPKGSRRSWKTVFFALGGPLANVAFACVALVLAVDSKFLSLVCPISLLLGIANLIPFHTRGFASDGMIIWNALSSSRKAIRDAAVLRLGQQLTTRRPRDYRKTWIEKALLCDDPTLATWYGNYFAYLHYNDTEQWELAAGRLEKCLRFAHCVDENLRRHTMLEAAVFHAWAWDDIEAAEKWKERVDDKGLERLFIVRWQTVAATARRDPSALKLWEEGNARLAEEKKDHWRAVREDSWREFRIDIEKRLQLAPGKARTATA